MKKTLLSDRDWARLTQGYLDNIKTEKTAPDDTIVKIDDEIAKRYGTVLMDKGYFDQALRRATEEIVSRLAIQDLAEGAADTIGDIIADMLLQGVIDAIVGKIVDAMLPNIGGATSGVQGALQAVIETQFETQREWMNYKFEDKTKNVMDKMTEEREVILYAFQEAFYSGR